VMLRQLMAPLLLRHLEVRVVLGVQKIDLVNRLLLGQNVLLLLALRKQTLPRHLIRYFYYVRLQHTQLKDTCVIVNQIMRVLNWLISLLVVKSKRFDHLFQAKIILVATPQLLDVGQELKLYETGRSRHVGHKQSDFVLETTVGGLTACTLRPLWHVIVLFHIKLITL
jgi:hypothetical protein